MSSPHLSFPHLFLHTSTSVPSTYHTPYHATSSPYHIMLNAIKLNFTPTFPSHTSPRPLSLPAPSIPLSSIHCHFINSRPILTRSPHSIIVLCSTSPSGQIQARGKHGKQKFKAEEKKEEKNNNTENKDTKKKQERSLPSKQLFFFFLLVSRLPKKCLYIRTSMRRKEKKDIPFESRISFLSLKEDY